MTVQRRILVVDDNRDSAESLCLLLQIMGHLVRTAHDGTAALALAETFKPDIVLLDIGLPEINGYEVARRLRQRSPSTVLIAVTGWGQEDDRRQSHDAGFDSHLVKPINFDVLQALLQ